MVRELLPQQREALKWAEGKTSVAFFMRMRLGKTLTSIRWLQANNAGSVLVLAPLNVLPSWVDELSLEKVAATHLVGSRRVKELQHERAITQTAPWRMHVTLLNPESFRGSTYFQTHEWDAVVVDESQFFRRPTTKISKLLSSLQRPRLRCLLSGDPCPESILDYFQQMKFLYDEFLGCRTYWEFRARYFMQYGFKWVPKKGVKDKILKEVGNKAFVLTEKQAGMRMTKLRIRRSCTMPTKLRVLYLKASKEFLMGKYMTMYSPVVHTWLSKMSGGCIPPEYVPGKLYYSPHKFELLSTLLHEELPNDPVVVYFRFTREIVIAHRLLRKKFPRRAIHVLYGAVPTQLRSRILERYRTSKSNDVLLVQSKIVRHGIDLSRSYAGVFFSNWWDYETRSQCESRLLHPLKKVPSYIYDLTTEDTLDTSVVRALRKKRNNVQEFADCVRSHYLKGVR